MRLFHLKTVPRRFLFCCGIPTSTFDFRKIILLCILEFWTTFVRRKAAHKLFPENSNFGDILVHQCYFSMTGSSHFT